MLNKTKAILQSNKFFYIALILFVLSAAWIALSGLYSMAYDENTHFGIMQLYADYHRWLPFWSSQPPGSSGLGALTRDPSYMYRFLMSFPLRLIEPFIQTQTAQVLVIRAFSIAFFVSGLILFRRLLLKTKASKAIVHTVLVLLMFTPMSPFLAAQINYDNLLFPLTALTLLLALRVVERLKQKQVDSWSLLWLLTVCMFSSLVMYSFLPIFLAAVLWVCYALWRQSRRLGGLAGWTKLWQSARTNFGKLSLASKLMVSGGFILLTGLFMQAYGYNLVRYHTPVARCAKIMSVDDCMQYAPFKRDYESHRDLQNGTLQFQYHVDPISFTLRDWVRIMSYNMFFALNGEVSHFAVGEPLILPRLMALVIGIVGLPLVLWYQKRLRKHYRWLVPLVFVSLVYLVILWHQEYTAFLYNGYAVAIQGRYLIPVLPILYLVVALAIAEFLRRWQSLKAVIAWLAIFILCFQGGGAMVFILRSDNYWYWPNRTVQQANESAQKVLKTFVIGS